MAPQLPPPDEEEADEEEEEEEEDGGPQPRPIIPPVEEPEPADVESVAVDDAEAVEEEEDDTPTALDEEPPAPPPVELLATLELVDVEVVVAGRASPASHDPPVAESCAVRGDFLRRSYGELELCFTSESVTEETGPPSPNPEGPAVAEEEDPDVEDAPPAPNDVAVDEEEVLPLAPAPPSAYSDADIAERHCEEVVVVEEDGPPVAEPVLVAVTPVYPLLKFR